MHKEFMLLALAQAKLGRGGCAPNPSVGAVAVHHNRVIAEAWHQGAGLPHAERLALKQIAQSITEVTLYVTLEPCNHWGLTPPCVDAIIAHRIQRVVYAYTDPNPQVAAQDTPSLLRAKGIDVIHYPLPEIEQFYTSYAYWVRTRRPWVTVKIAQTLDGKIAGYQGNRIPISNEVCSEFTHQQRNQTDVILTTARTLLQDNPLLNARIAGRAPGSKPLAILDSHLSVTPNLNALKHAKRVHIYFDEAQQVTQPNPAWQYTPVSCAQQRLDLDAVLDHLGRLGYHDVWVEAGARLFSELHRAQLVNRTYIYVAAKSMGDIGLSLYTDDLGFDKATSIAWQVMDDNAMLTLEW